MFRIAGNVELRPWRLDDAQAVVDATLDPDIQQWNRPGREVTPKDTRQRIARRREGWRAERAAIQHSVTALF